MLTHPTRSADPGGKRDGFSAIEMLIAFVLLALIAGSMLKALNGMQRTSGAQMAVVRMGTQTRDAGRLLSSLLRDMDAADLDLVAMGSDSLIIKATQQVAFICQAPVSPYSSVVIAATRSYGTRWFDPTRDSLLIYADADTTSSRNDRWLRASLGSVSMGAGSCADGSAPATLTLSVSDTAGNAALDKVTLGAPVRSSVLERLWLQQDSTGKWYLVTSQLVNGSWTASDDYAGPLLANGVAFTYYDSAGAVTALPQRVVSIGIVVRGQSATPETTDGLIAHTTAARQQDSVVTLVALRNNPHG